MPAKITRFIVTEVIAGAAHPPLDVDQDGTSSLYIEKDGGVPKAAIFLCPCGCRRQIRHEIPFGSLGKDGKLLVPGRGYHIAQDGTVVWTPFTP